MAAATGIKAGRAFVVINAVDRTGAILRRASRRFSAFATNIASMGRTLAFGAGAALIPIGKSVMAFAEYEATMLRVMARSHGTMIEFEALKNQVRSLAKATVFTVHELGLLQEILGKRGFSRSDIKEQTPHIVNFARAAASGRDKMEDLTMATTLAVTAQNQFGLEAKDTEHTVDLMTAAINNSALSLETLTNSMTYIGPIAKELNMSLEDTLLILGRMGNVGIEGSRGGTTFRRMLTQIINKSKELNVDLGINVEDVNTRNMADFVGIIEQIHKKLKSLGKGKLEIAAVFAKIFNVRAMPGAMSLMSGMKERDLRLRDALRDVSKEAKRTAAIMDGSLKASLLRLVSAFTDVKVSIGDALSGALRELSENVIKPMLVDLGALIDKSPELVIAFTTWAVVALAVGLGLLLLAGALKLIAFVIGVLLIPFVLFNAAIGLIVGAFTALVAIISFAITPLGLFVAALAIIIARSKDVQNSVVSLVDTMLSRFSDLKNSLSTTFSGIYEALEHGELEKAWEIAVLGMGVIWKDFVALFVDAWKHGVIAVLEMAKALKDYFEIELTGGIAQVLHDTGATKVWGDPDEDVALDAWKKDRAKAVAEGAAIRKKIKTLVLRKASGDLIGFGTKESQSKIHREGTAILKQAHKTPEGRAELRKKWAGVGVQEFIVQMNKDIQSGGDPYKIMGEYLASKEASIQWIEQRISAIERGDFATSTIAESEANKRSLAEQRGVVGFIEAIQRQYHSEVEAAEKERGVGRRQLGRTVGLNAWKHRMGDFADWLKKFNDRLIRAEEDVANRKFGPNEDVRNKNWIGSQLANAIAKDIAMPGDDAAGRAISSTALIERDARTVAGMSAYIEAQGNFAKMRANKEDEMLEATLDNNEEQKEQTGILEVTRDTLLKIEAFWDEGAV